MIQRDSPFVLIQALATLGRQELLKRLAARGHTEVGMPDIKLLWCLGEEPITVQQAAQMMGTTKQFAARTVAKLNEAGLVEVKSHPGDRRASAVKATREGATFIEVVAEERDAIERDWGNRIGSEQMREIAERLNSLLPAFG